MTEYEKKLAKARVKLQKADLAFRDVLAECPHETTEPKETYYEAGYDYVSETHMWNECTVCGEQSEITIRYGSSFN